MIDHKEIHFQIAEIGDLPGIISLLVDDELGKGREIFSKELDPSYISAFKEIEKDPNNEVIIGKSEKEVVAVLQITYIPNLTLKGTKRAQIEGVRVSSSLRGQGIGKKLFEFALNRAQKRGCGLVQLTTNKARPDALRFYESMGFKASHDGLKMGL